MNRSFIFLFSGKSGKWDSGEPYRSGRSRATNGQTTCYWLLWSLWTLEIPGMYQGNMEVFCESSVLSQAMGVVPNQKSSFRRLLNLTPSGDWVLGLHCWIPVRSEQDGVAWRQSLPYSSGPARGLLWTATYPDSTQILPRFATEQPKSDDPVELVETKYTTDRQLRRLVPERSYYRTSTSRRGGDLWHFSRSVPGLLNKRTVVMFYLICHLKTLTILVW